jgi:hypothetical protein
VFFVGCRQVAATDSAGKQGLPDGGARQLFIEKFSIWVYTCFDFSTTRAQIIIEEG